MELLKEFEDESIRQILSDFFFRDLHRGGYPHQSKDVYEDLMTDGNEIWDFRGDCFLKDSVGVDVPKKLVEWIQSHPGSDLGVRWWAIFENFDAIKESLTTSEREDIAEKIGKSKQDDTTIPDLENSSSNLGLALLLLLVHFAL